MKKKQNKISPAGWCWGGLVGYVLIADSFLIKKSKSGQTHYYTMSTAFRESLAHPIKRWPIMMLWGLLTFHLFDFFFPDKVKQYEPIRFIGNKFMKD